MATLKYTVKSRLTGIEYVGQLGYDIKKTLDKRDRTSSIEHPQIVWECRNPTTGKWDRVWTDEMEGEAAGVYAEVVERA